jgi:hypothetical protein
MTHLLDGTLAGKLAPDLMAGYKFGDPISSVSEPANIVWTNRANTTSAGPGDTDKFGETFGTKAPVARAIVDAAIVQYERMIGSFNYPVAGEHYSLTVTMGSPFGPFSGGAGMSTTLLGGKPHAGSLVMGVGNVNADPNDDNGWFLDPTPFDSSEFRGGFYNAFAGSAHAGSPAENKFDFFSVVCAELTHDMGLNGDIVPSWHALTSDTGAPDVNQGGTGNLWVFRGPSIKHLLTSNMGGVFGIDAGCAVHSAGGMDVTTFDGVEYKGNFDQGTAMNGWGARLLVNDTFALMFKDAFNYASVNPAEFSTGTMYSILDQVTGKLYVRGGEEEIGWSIYPLAADRFKITRTGDTIAVSVDPYHDAPGSGAMPGEGDLPPWVTYYDASQITSIQIDGAGDADLITIDANIGVPVSLVAQPGQDDKVVVLGTPGVDTVGLNSNGAILINGIPFSFTHVSNFSFEAGEGNDAFAILTSPNATLPASIKYDAGVGDDRMFVRGSPGADTVSFVDGTFHLPGALAYSAENETYSFDGGQGGDFLEVVGGPTLHLIGPQDFVEFDVSGNVVVDPSPAANPATPYLIRAEAFSITSDATLDLNNNAMMLDDPSTPTWFVRNLIASGRSGGNWLGKGLTSSTARLNAMKNTTLGYMDNFDWHAIAGANALFVNHPVDNGAVLIKYTYLGDTDLNGVVNFDDYSRTDHGFTNQLSGWVNGDFDNNNEVNFDDYALIDRAFQTQGALLVAYAAPSKPMPHRSVFR